METTSRPILIADDEIHIVTMLKRRLVSLGYEVLVARSGDEALEMAKASSPFFAVIDFQMPGLNGVQLATRIKTEVERPPKIVMLTGRSHLIEEHEFEPTGITALLEKPFSMQQVLELIPDARPEEDAA